jgi:predicted dehydrogenase
MPPEADAPSAAGTIRLGVVGMSEGNGHPYSWSAIINGYDPLAMSSCPYPAIPAYLSREQFPQAQIPGARVTHIWTEEEAISRHVAAASRIPTVVRRFTDMVGEVDALLLARDDAENHLAFAGPFLGSGVPVYVDKPVAINRNQLDALYAVATGNGHIFSCSALRYSDDLTATAEEIERIGPIVHVSGTAPKSWNRYAVHLIDPIVSAHHPGELRQTAVLKDGKAVAVSASWTGGFSATIVTTGEAQGDIAMTLVGARGSVHRVFRNPFAAFRAALVTFLSGVRTRRTATPYDHLRRVVELVETGADPLPASANAGL